MQQIKDRITEVIVPELSSMGIDLIDFDLIRGRGQFVVRLFVDKANDTSKKCSLAIADCEKISRAIERLLEVEDVIPGAYVLEVSTPGIERPLRKVDDYVRFTGELAGVTAYDGYFQGRIKEVIEQTIVFDVNGKEKALNFSEIKKAKLKYEE